MTIEEFIHATVIGDLGIMVFTPKLKYLSFGVMASMIEFLGACLDDKDFSQRDCSQIRFNKAIEDLGALVKYKQFIKSDFDFYGNLRCGMLHTAIPGKGIELTERADPKGSGKHLEVHTLRGRDQSARLFLVCEDFYEDICKGAEELIEKMKNGTTHKKASMTCLFTDFDIAH